MASSGSRSTEGARGTTSVGTVHRRPSVGNYASTHGAVPMWATPGRSYAVLTTFHGANQTRLEDSVQSEPLDPSLSAKHRFPLADTMAASDRFAGAAGRNALVVVLTGENTKTEFDVAPGWCRRRLSAGVSSVRALWPGRTMTSRPGRTMTSRARTDDDVTARTDGRVMMSGTGISAGVVRVRHRVGP